MNVRSLSLSLAPAFICAGIICCAPAFSDANPDQAATAGDTKSSGGESPSSGGATAGGASKDGSAKSTDKLETIKETAGTGEGRKGNWRHGAQGSPSLKTARKRVEERSEEHTSELQSRENLV